ncbi:MAG: hypothetical protein Q9M36_04095 [Sulfurovum sp.]|nr:hypothetical protein [Sulfurovum sp.]
MHTLLKFLSLGFVFILSLTSLYATALPLIATPPLPPKVIEVQGSITQSRTIHFSPRVPPEYIAHRLDNIQAETPSNVAIGEVNGGRISAYLRGTFMDVTAVEKTLKDAGFTVLTSTPVNKKKTLTSVVFSHPQLISMASKPYRGFLATLRVLIDSKEQTISITNPLYMSKGFLQEDFEETSAKVLLAKIVQAFPTLQNSKDSLKFQLLPSYQFMKGMPEYQQMIEIASGDDLEERIKDHKKVVFIQKLKHGAILIGIKLGKRSRKFTKRIGRNNAGMLPYPILIENGTAKILDPKYYISYMYPLLQMEQFMTIATIPDAIVKDCRRIFRKKKKSN